MSDMHYSRTAATLAVLAVAGCSQATPGTAAPITPSSSGVAPSQSAPTGNADNQVKAPPVQNPLDTTKFIADPCLTLTPAQVQQFGGTKPGGRADSPSGVGCDWALGPNGSAGTGVDFVPKVTTGLTNLYRQNAAGWNKDTYWEPTEINGYPAVYNEPVDSRPQGGCGLVVATSEPIFFDVSISGRPGTDGCKAALNVAKTVLQTIQGGQ